MTNYRQEIEVRLKALYSMLKDEEAKAKPALKYIEDLNLSIGQCENNLKAIGPDGIIIHKA